MKIQIVFECIQICLSVVCSAAGPVSLYTKCRQHAYGYSAINSQCCVDVGCQNISTNLVKLVQFNFKKLN